MKRVQVDLNVRVRGNKTYAGYEDVVPEGAPVAVGEQVLVWEAEDDIVTDGTVIELDDEKQIIYLDVDWRGFRDAHTFRAVRPDPAAAQELRTAPVRRTRKVP